MRHDPQRRALADRVAEAQELQHEILGYMPGFATPRIVCDVPFVGKRWVHMLGDYDRDKGISYWTKNYRTGIEFEDPEALTRQYEYYDPIYTLPEEGQEWWRRRCARGSTTCSPNSPPNRASRSAPPERPAPRSDASASVASMTRLLHVVGAQVSPVPAILRPPWTSSRTTCG